jgi:hypothetical protein
MALEVLAINSDNLVRLDGLTNASSAAYINNATVTYALLDNTGATVTSGSLSYVAASNGRYEGTVAYTISLTLNAFYTLQVTAIGGGSPPRAWLALRASEGPSLALRASTALETRKSSSGPPISRRISNWLPASDQTPQLIRKSRRGQCSLLSVRCKWVPATDPDGRVRTPP